MKPTRPYLKSLPELVRTLVLTAGLIGGITLPVLVADELDDLTRQFNQLYREGRFQRAARVGERALRVAENLRSRACEGRGSSRRTRRALRPFERFQEGADLHRTRDNHLHTHAGRTEQGNG